MCEVKPLVSVLIACYNHRDFLDECLKSVLGQSFQDWEIVLVDDLSGDSSYEVAQRWAAKDARIGVFQNETNLGTYGTQQRALELSTGEYVAILNSDDYWEANKLSLQVAELDKHQEATWCFARARSIGSSADKGIEMPGESWPNQGVFNAISLLLPQNEIAASSVIFRRDGLKFNPELRYSGDWLALLLASLRGPAVAVPEVLSYWRQHESNSYVRSPAQLEEEIWLRAQIALIPRTLVRNHRAMNAYAESLCHLIALHVLASQMEKARILGSAALIIKPTLRTLKRWLVSRMPGEKALTTLWPGQTGVDPGVVKTRSVVRWGAD